VVAHLRAATGGRLYTGGCINLMWTDLVVLPRLLDPLGVALRGVERFLLRGNPKRCTTRHIVGTLTRMPVVSTARVHNSSKVASGWSCTSRRTWAWAVASKRGR
jgi:hypothetical protein